MSFYPAHWTEEQRVEADAWRLASYQLAGHAAVFVSRDPAYAQRVQLRARRLMTVDEPEAAG